MSYTEIIYYDQNTKLVGSLYQAAGDTMLILFPAFEGPSEFCHDYAKKLQSMGFSVFIADMYGEKQVAKTLDACFSCIHPFLESRALVRKRAKLAYQAALEKCGANPDHLGAFGFCFGGMCALELARSGCKIKSICTLHGVLKKSELETSHIASSILVLHGFKDPQIPPESLLEFSQEMDKAFCKDWQFMFFGQAKHSFTDPKTGTFDLEKETQMGRAYHELSAKRSYNYLLAFFKETLQVP